MAHQKIIHITLIIAFILYSHTIWAQSLNEQWAKCYGGNDYDESRDIVQIGDYYYVLANTNSVYGDISNNHGGTDIWLIKTDLLGNMVFEKCYGGTHGDGAYNILKASDTSLYIVGSSKSIDGDISYNPFPGSQNLWILKIDTIGNIIWDKMTGGSKRDRDRNAILSGDGGLIQLGLTFSTDGDVSHHYGSYDVWLTKIDSEGELEWDFTLGSGGFEEAGTILQTSDGGYIVTVSTSGEPGGNYDTACNFHGYPGGGFLGAWIIKLDSLRNIEWQQCYGGFYHDYAMNIVESDDGYIAVGATMSNDGDVDGYHGEPGNTDNAKDIWVFKIDFQGNLIWQKCLGGFSNDFARNVFPLSDGNYMVIGYTTSDDGDVVGYHHGNVGLDGDIWFIKLSSEGELLWQFCYGENVNDQIHFGVIQKSDYHYVLALTTDSELWRCESSMVPDLRIVELADTLTAINDKYDKQYSVIAYPIPAESVLNIDYNFHKAGRIGQFHIWNSNGQLIHSSDISLSNGSLMINIESWRDGLYIYSVTFGGQNTTGKFMINR